MSQSNMGVLLGKGSDPSGTEWPVDSRMWNQLPLPSSVAPSFETCNISRYYEIEVRLGLSYGSIGDVKVCRIPPILFRGIYSNPEQPQLIVLPLRIPVKVYSGIAPPKALLEAMAESGRVPPSMTARPTRPSQEPPSMPQRPTGPPEPTSVDQAGDDVAPPSYEDAMAESLSPVDGPRREYNPPDASSSRRTIESGTDSKSTANPGKDSENSTPYLNPGANSSEETFDMLPSTPPESQSGSPPTSPVARQQSILKIHKAAPPPEDHPPQYQSIAGNSLQSPSNPVRRHSGSDVRPMNLGVPNRKPVPRSPNLQG